MSSFVEAFLVPVRAGLTFIVRFNLIVGVVGAITAFAWNPQATLDEIVVVVTTPAILYYVAARIIGALLRPAPSPSTPQLDVQVSSHERSSISPEERRKSRRVLLMVRLMLYSLVLICLSCGPLLALPLYLWLEISWAVSYGLFMAAVMFITGVCMFVLALSRLAPGLWQAIKTTAWPALLQLLPGSVSSR